MASVNTVRIPKPSRHKATGQAVVRLNGHDFYLGVFKSAAARERYDRLINEWLVNGRQLSQGRRLKINDLILAYWRHCKDYYRKPDGTGTTELNLIQSALRHVKALYGRTVADEFGPTALKTVRQKMIDSAFRGVRLSRGVVNRYIDRVRRMFRWAVETNLVLVAVYQALLTVEGLKYGRTDARETAPVKPVAKDLVDAILPHVPEQIVAMIQLQLLTGCRPGEACSIRPCEIDITQEPWVYRPESHKTKHHGEVREIFIGPRIQVILRPWLKRGANDFLFSPREAQAARNAARRAKRKSPLTPSQARRKPRAEAKRAPGGSYTTTSYRRAIWRACEAAFPPPESLPDDQRKKWRLDHRWSPNQLRHSAGTRIRKQFGLEAAQVALGHKKADVTQTYAERDTKLAAKVAKKVG